MENKKPRLQNPNLQPLNRNGLMFQFMNNFPSKFESKQSTLSDNLVYQMLAAKKL